MTGQRASSNSGDERVATGTSQQAGSSNIGASGSGAMVGGNSNWLQNGAQVSRGAVFTNGGEHG